MIFMPQTVNFIFLINRIARDSLTHFVATLESYIYASFIHHTKVGAQVDRVSILVEEHAQRNAVFSLVFSSKMFDILLR